MKKILSISLVLLFSWSVWAQSDSTITKAIVPDATITSGIAQDDTSTASGMAQGDTSATSGMARDDTSRYEEVQYKAPNRNPIYYFGSPFAHHFAEVDFLLGLNDLGIGFTYTYLPEVWGGHITGIAGFCARWLMVGTDYRLSKPWNKSDWHLYGSLGYRHGTKDRTLMANAPRNNIGFGPAMEVGVRVGRVPSHGTFCLTSANLGLLTDFQNVYVTLGFSCTMAVLASAFIFLGM